MTKPSQPDHEKETPMIIHSSAPARIDPPATVQRMDPEKLRAMRAHAARIIMERNAAGLHADGRIIDFAKYSAHLDAGRA